MDTTLITFMFQATPRTQSRTGGLKMASTYYYYYELDDGIEVHDTAIPFTTTCPYMPGQPVNILWVPVEVSPPRLRSGSVDSINLAEAKTLNPADKFMTLRAPPLKPGVGRSASLSSSHAEMSKDKKLGWATKLFFRSSTKNFIAKRTAYSKTIIRV
ncbi:hypothetical protein DID88_005142 [Monilinia fructigena]|uniref:Uncharacterized protein n=1 Tax=Monilinia fructigena TaxID=38457 RepID=A0A395IDJ2_9HELO|nr:hypothetical protein DID88_005142 [Monilinia fructigena]